MKKILLFTLLLALAGFAKAQNQSFKNTQAFSTKDLGIIVDTVPPTITYKAPELGQLQKDRLTNLLALKNAATKPVYNEVFYSTMPVVGTSSRDTNMPVVRTDDLHTQYYMPVKRIGIVNPTKAKPAVANP